MSTKWRPLDTDPEAIGSAVRGAIARFRDHVPLPVRDRRPSADREWHIKYGGFVVAAIGFVLTRVVVLPVVHLDVTLVQFLAGEVLPLVFFAQIAAIAPITTPPSESTGPVLSPEVGQAGYTEITAFTVLAAAFFLVVGFTGGRVGRATVNLLAHFVARLPLCGPGHRLPATRFAVHAAASTGADRPAVPIAPAGNRQSHSSGLVS